MTELLLIILIAIVVLHNFTVIKALSKIGGVLQSIERKLK